MTRIERLYQRYREVVGSPWKRDLPPEKRVWFLVYDPSDERRVRARLDEFELITGEAGHEWQTLDITDAFPDWLKDQPYRDYYFQEPEYLDEGALEEFEDWLCSRVIAELDACENEAVCTMVGVAGLFGFLHLSKILDRVKPHIKGRLLVLFPGQHRDNTYRLLDARDGWDYLALPITA